MTQEWSVPGWVALATLAALLALVLVLAWALLRGRSRAGAAVVSARAETAALREQVEAIERRLSRPEQPIVDEAPRDYVITRLGDLADSESETEHERAPTVAGPLFADLVLREGVVQTAALAAGVRRALTSEARHRIRFEMKREVKRARKQRKVEQREARRDWESRQRAAGEHQLRDTA